jgi:LPXTG-motif cell wall-anchored protein
MRATPFVSRHPLRWLTSVGVLTGAFVLVLALVPSAAVVGGDHGACGTGDWVKFEWSGGGFETEWSREAFTDLPLLEVTEWKEGEPITVAWTHEDDTEPVWVVEAVWLKAGSESSGAGLIGPFPGGTSGTATTVGATTIAKGISFVVFCFDLDVPDEPTETETTEPEPTETETTEPEPTDTETTEPEPTDTETTEPEPQETETIEPEPQETETIEPEPQETTEPEPTETETDDQGVLPDETERPTSTPETPRTEAPAAESTDDAADTAVLGEQHELPHTGAPWWTLLAAGLGALSGGVVLVRRTS